VAHNARAFLHRNVGEMLQRDAAKLNGHDSLIEKT
jgi:hypothetical protein